MTEVAHEVAQDLRERNLILDDHYPHGTAFATVATGSAGVIGYLVVVFPLMIVPFIAPSVAGV
ncbi:MAG TPA: hypothetical protein VMM79_02945 [Longimicrobiales bacterium]|nr:hypothetical protein [Longimicrobiales bacterium]